MTTLTDQLDKACQDAGWYGEATIHHLVLKEISDRIKEALDYATYGQIDGGHHKTWVIDQMVRALTGQDYDYWVKDFEHGEDGPETYFWDTGIAP